ncbi:DNA/RNA non-specific endonuclease [Nitrospira sp. BLG_1]|uniref:DNA/RNA non-specific endonuclease n=1 Tax=Nitrospira sp. BLG_1 TaxID=3395883 RepID=UPI0039BD635E
MMKKTISTQFREFSYILLIHLAVVGCASNLKPADCSKLGEMVDYLPTHDRICHRGFLVDHSPNFKTPAWVVEELTPQHISRMAFPKRAFGWAFGTLSFEEDPALLPGRKSTLEDYRDVPFQRGHMVPAADMAHDQDAMKQTFYLSNIAPQLQSFNTGIWVELEKSVRQLAKGGRSLIVITGPVFEEPLTRIGGNAVAVPTQFFKIVLDTNNSALTAFLVPHMEVNSNKSPSEFKTNLKHLESRVGTVFFPSLGLQKYELPTISSDESPWN